MNEVLRVEQKYLMTLVDYKKSSAYFEKILHQDKHNGIDGYPIRSLYFDTLNNKDYSEKDEGVEIRKKIRLRLYDPKAMFASLEMKQKQGDSQKKRSLKITRDDAILLTKGNYSPLLKYSDPFAAECFAIMNMQCYRPKSVVQYNRKAFIANENNIRVTFDSNITANEACFDIFSENLNLYPVFDKFNVVLEVKYNGFMLGYIQDIINSVNKSRLSVSKYCLGRAVSMKYIF